VWWLRLAGVAVLGGALLAVGVFAWASRDLPTPEGIAHRVVAQSTKIYDRTGKTVLYDIHGTERRTAVELSDIPQTLIWATLTAEDRQFYEHRGFRLTSLIRALLVDLTTGTRAQGGSTITQQFIKNAILGSEKSVFRKVKELILAYQIERKFSKDEILKLYFNEIPWGSNAYGAEAASQLYFGKSVKDINLAESTILSAMAQRPTYYSPWGTHLDELFARQHYILDGMADQKYITPEQAKAAEKTEVKFQPRREAIIAPHFVFYVKELLAEIYGERIAEGGGLKVITTLDLDRQRQAEAAINASAEKNKSYNASNAALVALDVPTNQILAMVGSRDYFDDTIQGQVNVAVRPRQPGSSFKPVVYAAAFAEGFTPDTILFDVPTTFKTDIKDYTPNNYDGKARGPVSLRQALAGSLNIPAVKLLYLTGISKVLDLAQALGYTTLSDRSRFGLSLVLGGAEVSLLEHTSTYAAFAREGATKPVVGILKVEDSRGTTLEQYEDTAGPQAIEQNVVRTLTNVLSDNEARAPIFGASNYLTLPDRPVAAKTGTTNDYHDAWTLGYTPQIAAGVWVGNSNNQAMKRGADGSVVAAPIWQAFMRAATSGLPIQGFTSPEPTWPSKPVLAGTLGQVVVLDSLSGYRATDLTPPEYRVPKLFHEYHTILRYVTPGDPLGPNPQTPEADPQYENWEAGVRAWAQARGLTDELPPQGLDNVHTDANRPQPTLTSPVPNQTITQNPMSFSVAVQSPRPIAKVVYLLDQQEVGSVNESPFTLSFPITEEWANGFHTAQAIAYDDIGNSGSASSTFNLLVTPLPSPQQMTFTNLSAGQLLSTTDFPRELTVSLRNPGVVKQLDLYLKPENGQARWLGVEQAPGPEARFTLALLPPGTYTLSLLSTEQDGTTHTGPRVTVLVAP
jgi:penicillin-binding protein 1C